MKHLSYFLALVAIGTFALLIVLEPVAAMFATLLVGALGLSTTLGRPQARRLRRSCRGVDRGHHRDLGARARPVSRDPQARY